MQPQPVTRQHEKPQQTNEGRGQRRRPVGRNCLSHVLDRGSYLSPAALLTILAACEGNRPSEGTANPPQLGG